MHSRNTHFGGFENILMILDVPLNLSDRTYDTAMILVTPPWNYKASQKMTGVPLPFPTLWGRNLCAVRRGRLCIGDYCGYPGVYHDCCSLRGFLAKTEKDEGYGGTMEVAVDDHQWGGRTWQPLNGTWARLGSSWPSWEGFPQWRRFQLHD